VEYASQLQGLRLQELDLSLVALHSEAQPALDRLLLSPHTELVHEVTVPDLYKYAVLRGRVEGFQGLPVISLSESPTVGWRGAVKRGIDLVLAIPTLMLAAPCLLLVAAAIKLTSRGPALFFQERMGGDGKTFKLVKFRTMRADAESETGPVWARNRDPRCTRLGTFLRKTSIDELPQLWNVIKGEMSLVGPRPERPVFVEQFGRELPRYMLRHTVKGGITGWAQVNGWRGNTSISKRLEHDLDYIQNWSPLLDLKILWRTLAGGFLNRLA
jgi:exopolysaccharide biosynthesis polyprenyl glycosylphosphotransferase